MKNQLQTQFIQNNILHRKQFGFGWGPSTTAAGVELLESVISSWEDKLDAFGVFCDLSKVFDCVFHEILVKQLFSLWNWEYCFGLFIFYLGTRFHKVEVKGQRSLGSLMTMEVPQGSIEQEFFFCAEIPRIPPASGYIGIKRTKNHTPSRVLEIEGRTSGHLRFVGIKPT